MVSTSLKGNIHKSKTIHLEDLGSVGMLRTLNTIAIHGPLNISLLARKTGMNHSNVDRHVKKLVKIGLIIENHYGSLRILKPAFSSFTIQFKKSLGVKLSIESLDYPL